MIPPALKARIPAPIKARLREQLDRRRAALSRPIRILRGLPEYLARAEAADRVDARDRMEIAGLARDGFQMVSLAPDLLSPLLITCRERLASGAARPARKDFFSHLVDESDLGFDGVFMRVALDPVILNSVAAYLGCAPFLDSVDLLLSKRTGDTLQASQLWHEDLTEKALVKLFVYINDVDDPHGPFTLIPRRPSADVPTTVAHYVGDDEMRRHVPDSAIRYLKGPAGTAFFVDTRNCFHRGSRCVEPRLAFVVCYSSGFGYYDRLRSWPAPSPAMSPMQRLALGHRAAT